MADVESVHLVGHEPTLTELSGLLIGGSEASIRLRPGTVATLNAPKLSPEPLRRDRVAADAEPAGGTGSLAPPTREPPARSSPVAPSPLPRRAGAPGAGRKRLFGCCG